MGLRKKTLSPGPMSGALLANLPKSPSKVEALNHGELYTDDTGMIVGSCSDIGGRDLGLKCQVYTTIQTLSIGVTWLRKPPSIRVSVVCAGAFSRRTAAWSLG